jgi:rhodanese-related sulfurtransferase
MSGECVRNQERGDRIKHFKRRMAVTIIFTVMYFLLFNTGETWERVDVDTFEQSMEDNPDAFLLDVRTQAEWEQDGHLERAVLIPHSSLEDRANELPEDKDELIQLYCRSGNRSIDAANTLIDLGYTNIVELKTGINGWKEANKPVLYGE